MIAALLHLALAVSLQEPAATATPEIPAQLGVSVSPDTVTVGQQFIVVIRVKAPRGATITLPAASDSAYTSSPTATVLIGKPAIQPIADSSGTTVSGAYRFAAWDVGIQRLGLPDIMITLDADTGYVSLLDRTVLVRSVLPVDTTQREPKPARPLIELLPFDWTPSLIAALILAAGLLLWRLWIWYRHRRERSLDPYTAAQREFARIESLELIRSGDPERHAALMTDVLRDYLAARVEDMDRSQTSSELLMNAGSIYTSAPGLGDLLWRADLIKFAKNTVGPDEADKLGATAKSMVRSVELALLEKETEQKAA
jgi:hypothetical protein